MAMNPEVRQEWTAALRSGEYPKAQGYLHTEDGYCCLGVLCDIAVKHEVTTVNGINVYRYGPDLEMATLPEEVMRWAGLDKPNPEVDAPEGFINNLGESRTVTTLAEINDNRDEDDVPVYDFNVIADIIDAQL